MKETKVSNSKLKIIIIIFLFNILIIGGFFGSKIIYNSGIEKGKADFKKETEEKISALSSAVLEKSDFSNLVSETLSDFPAESDEEDFKNYLESLNNLISKINLENIKTELNNYKNSVSAFLDFYENSSDNEEILEKYNELKSNSKNLSEKLLNIFNENITAAANNLKN